MLILTIRSTEIHILSLVVLHKPTTKGRCYRVRSSVRASRQIITLLGAFRDIAARSLGIFHASRLYGSSACATCAQSYDRRQPHTTPRNVVIGTANLRLLILVYNAD